MTSEQQKRNSKKFKRISGEFWEYVWYFKISEDIEYRTSEDIRKQNGIRKYFIRKYFEKHLMSRGLWWSFSNKSYQ